MALADDFTAQLVALRDQPQAMMQRLLPAIYDELRQIAHLHLAGRGSDTLNTTALVHELYLRFVDQTRLEPRDRAHFLALCSRAMRFVVIDHAREKQAQKRGGHLVRQPLDTARLNVEAQAEGLLALDEALTRLAQLSDRLALVVECRFFGGFTVEETAEVLGIAPRTVKRDWQKARLWLYQQMRDPP